MITDAKLTKTPLGYQYKGIHISKHRNNKWSIRTKDAYPNWDGSGNSWIMFWSLSSAQERIDRVRGN
jgi:hypothetical protein